MAENKDEKPKEGKKLPIGMILQVGFAVINLSVTGLGAFWVYKATIAWNAPQITEEQFVNAGLEDGHGKNKPGDHAEAEKPKEEHGGSEPQPVDEHGNPVAAADSGEDLLIYTMEKFTVNLAGNPKRTIRIEINLEMLNKDGFEEIIVTDNRAKARDEIMRILNEKTYADLESIQGKLFLKDRIVNGINALLSQGVVKDIYFSEFVVQ